MGVGEEGLVVRARIRRATGESGREPMLETKEIVAPNLKRLSLPIRGTGHFGITRKEWVKIYDLNVQTRAGVCKIVRVCPLSQQ